MNQSIQVVRMVFEDGSVANYTGSVQMPAGELPAVTGIEIFDIEKPMNAVAESLAVARSTLQTISKTHLSDAQRLEMLNKSIKKLEAAK